MKIAVLGAAGFLGTYITQHLKATGHTVFEVSRKTLDLTDFSQVNAWLKLCCLDVVINCATTGGKQRMGDAVLDDVQNNLNIFLNFYNNSSYFKKFINIGSGSEFDVTTNINCAREEDVFTSFPKDSYGYSKNVISRLSAQHEKFYTLRLFGCFDNTEPDFRLFKKFLSSESFELVDRQFDYFSAQDLCIVIDYYLNNKGWCNDVNCVYEDKLYLSEILSKFKPVTVSKTIEHHYTGDGARLAKLGLKLKGLDKSIKEYK
jgi:nucleoside-diphosphate-sugar epimerase